MRTHTEGKPYECSHCGKAFAVKWNLNMNSKTHIEEKPYKCSHGNKAFTRNGNLHIYRRSHTGEKPYLGSHCDMAFTEKGTHDRGQKTQSVWKLGINMRIHTGEKPYDCSNWDTAFLWLCSFLLDLEITGLTLGRNLISAAIVTCLSQIKELLIDTRRDTLWRKHINVVIVKRLSLKQLNSQYIWGLTLGINQMSAPIVTLLYFNMINFIESSNTQEDSHRGEALLVQPLWHVFHRKSNSW